MSVNSMTNAAIARRTDSPPVGRVPKGRAEIANAGAGKDTPQNSVTAALGVIATYIPSEILTLYVAALAAMQVTETTPESHLWKLFIVFLFATPVIVWLVYAAKLRSEQKQLPWRWREMPVWEMLAASLAYVAWAVSLPRAPFLEYVGLPLTFASVIVLGTSTALALLAPVFQLPIKPKPAAPAGQTSP